MALLVKDDGSKTEVTGSGKKGAFDLKQLYTLLETDMVQLVKLKPKESGGYSEVWMDEEGKMKDKGYNAEATKMAAHALFYGDCIVGHALFVEAKKKKTPQEHDWIELSDGNGISNFSCARCGVLKQTAGAGTKYHVPGKAPLEWQAKKPVCYPKESR